MNSPLNITTIDADYINHGIAALYMLEKNGHAAFIDTGTQHSFNNVTTAMHQQKISADNVEYVILTHIHLDHAGGASHMMEAFPNAQLVVHPFGSRHMADPSKLVAGTKAVYGDKKFLELYGELSPINANQIIETTDEMNLDFQGETLTFLDTPGHAKHHHCIYYENGKTCFTGDTLGLSYPDLNLDDENICLLPTTTPVQFSPNDLHLSIDKVMSRNPLTIYPTHFGAVRPTTENIARLHEHIDAFTMLAEQAQQDGNEETLTERLSEKILDYMTTQVINNNPNITRDFAMHRLRMDAELNSQGLAVWLKKYSK